MLLGGRTVVIVFLLCSSLVLLRLRHHSDSPHVHVKAGGQTNQGGCSGRLARLNDLGIKFPVKYASRDIIIKANSDLNRTSLTQIDAPLLSDVQMLDPVKNPDGELEQCSPSLTLEVPAFPGQPANASHIIFGISTYIKRMDDSIPHLQRSLAYTNARLIILAVDFGEVTPSRKEMAVLETRMHGLGIDATVLGAPKDSSMQTRYFSLAKILYERRDSKTQWISLLDDDTFLPSMHSLVDTLGTYDSSKEWYLGAMSEDWWSVMVYGMMSFGGGGTFLSIPLAAQINANYDTCLQESTANQGDIRVFQCITAHTTTKLQPLTGLHQTDLGGDLSGFYESGRLPLSLHHWKTGWHFEQKPEQRALNTYPMAKMHLVSDVCGDCFLQRWQFGSDTILSNGFSISTYPNQNFLADLVKNKDMDKIEDTFMPTREVNSFMQGYEHSIGPLRPRVEGKIQYKLLDAKAEDGGVRQYYIYKALDEEPDILYEIFWTRNETHV
ncbi:hypothetical protein HO173_009195 [Letharia columbiana]|uniref:Glycosyltransferase family 31 protein n=1 Tax=Letharia columbiana TaxID=112416 RepID=A0A8H6FPX5_9LECA|nr:uncharacterized protein HO173_009195 [Letharia columbiana]KAF6232527.1 hypothetical protein HO173_009195 [Letharia columbiana]